MAHMGRQEEDIALAQVHALELAAVGDQQRGIALELVEVLLVRVVMEVGALVGAAHHGADQVGVLPDLLVAHGRLQARTVGIEPLLEVQGLAVMVVGHIGRLVRHGDTHFRNTENHRASRPCSLRHGEWGGGN